MAKPADVSTKKLISLAPDNWVKWFRRQKYEGRRQKAEGTHV
jgi:hypothetical protein